MRIAPDNERNAAEVKLDRASFQAWLTAGGATNDEDLDRLKANLVVAMRDCLSDKRRLYITAYYVRGMSIPEIASLYGVNPSTVSRTISRGMRELYDHLRFTSPSLAECPNCFTRVKRNHRKGGK